MRVHNYEKLIVWQKAMDLVVAIYKLTEKFPKSETYGITSQMRRSTVSIPSNIAEGSRRKTNKEFRHFLITAFSSGAELETQVKIAKRLSFANADNYSKVDSLLDEVMKMLNVLIKSKD